MDFRIDIYYEFAQLVAKLKDATNSSIQLQNDSHFCATAQPQLDYCVTWFTQHAISPTCESRQQPQLQAEDVVFAVKTCEKHFQSRVPIIKRTWSKDARHILYFAESHNADIPTVDQGVANTLHGHCGKLHAMLGFVYADPALMRKKFLVIADDDTLLSVPRLLRLLSCYSREETPMALGQRYGYFSLNGHGYDYPTGGSSMILSMAALNHLMTSLAKQGPFCSSNDSPDDMILGMWLQRLGVPLIHSHLLHQARPMDYPLALIARQLPVSFHKFWECQPEKIYKEYLWEKSADGRDEL